MISWNKDGLETMTRQDSYTSRYEADKLEEQNQRYNNNTVHRRYKWVYTSTSIREKA